MLRIPDPVIHSLAIEIYQRNFLRRIDLWDGADTQTYEKSHVLVGSANHIGIEELRMLGVVKSSEDVRIHVVHPLILEDSLSESFRKFTALANLLFPALESYGSLAWCIHFFCETFGKLRIDAIGETKNRLGDIFLGCFAASAALHLSNVG